MIGIAVTLCVGLIWGGHYLIKLGAALRRWDEWDQANRARYGNELDEVPVEDQVEYLEYIYKL